MGQTKNSKCTPNNYFFSKSHFQKFSSRCCKVFIFFCSVWFGLVIWCYIKSVWCLDWQLQLHCMIQSRPASNSKWHQRKFTVPGSWIAFFFFHKGKKGRHIIHLCIRSWVWPNDKPDQYYSIGNWMIAHEEVSSIVGIRWHIEKNKNSPVALSNFNKLPTGNWESHFSRHVTICSHLAN